MEQSKKKVNTFKYLVVLTVFILGALGGGYLINTNWTKLFREYKQNCESMLNKYESDINKKDNMIQRLKLLNNNNLKSKSNMKAFILSINKKVYPELAEIIVDELYKMEEEYQIPAILGLMVIDVESDFNPLAISKANAVGLMQVNVNQWVGNKKNKDDLIANKIINNKNELFRPRENIRAGYYILNIYYNTCQGYITDGRLNGLGYINIYHCTFAKYFGGSPKNGYYPKVLQALGEYWVFTLVKNNNSNSENIAIITQDNKTNDNNTKKDIK
jgi:soluble lytic murein transglycosylase-like protein